MTENIRKLTDWLAEIIDALEAGEADAETMRLAWVARKDQQAAREREVADGKHSLAEAYVVAVGSRFLKTAELLTTAHAKGGDRLRRGRAHCESRRRGPGPGHRQAPRRRCEGGGGLAPTGRRAAR